MSKKILLAGESWMSYTTHVKGFDAFYTSTYETGEKWFRQAMEAAGYDYTFLPNHEATDGFPFTVEWCCRISVPTRCCVPQQPLPAVKKCPTVPR